jgi:hypothetical protein
MDFTFFHDLPGYVKDFYSWVSTQNGAYAFLVGVGFWFLIERIFAFVSNPISKILSVFGVLFVVCFFAAFFVDFASSYDRGSVPFEKATRTPGVETLRTLE